MEWDFDHAGEWDAESSLHDDGSHFVWRIVVCDDGSFDLSHSDAELMTRTKTFDRLHSAKVYCELVEAGQLNGSDHEDTTN
jgi:hypothetical protein